VAPDCGPGVWLRGVERQLDLNHVCDEPRVSMRLHARPGGGRLVNSSGVDLTNADLTGRAVVCVLSPDEPRRPACSPGRGSRSP
jgi:hypothetical protein